MTKYVEPIKYLPMSYHLTKYPIEQISNDANLPWEYLLIYLVLTMLVSTLLTIDHLTSYVISVTRLWNLLDFGKLFKAFGNN